MPVIVETPSRVSAIQRREAIVQQVYQPETEMRLCLIAIPLLFVASMTLAQADTKPPFEWKTSGSSVEDFHMEFVTNHEADQTTAKGVVLAYAAFSDNRESTAKMMKQVGVKWDAAVRKSLGKYEKELLTDDAIRLITSHEDDPAAGAEDTIRTQRATKVTGEVTDKAGITWVSTSQSVDTRQRKKGSDKWSSSTQELIRRFGCKKGTDGKWRIMKIEQNGQEDYSMLLFILYAQKLEAAAKAVPEADTTTAKGAAKSLFESLLRRREKFDNTVHAKGLDDWLDALKPLFTEDYFNAQDDMAEQWVKQKPVEAPREVESVKDGANDLKVVKFKPRDQWTGAIEIRVKKTDAGWRVVSACVYELGTNDDGKIGWIELEEPNLYKLANR